MTKKQFCKRLFWQTLYVDLDDLCLNTFELEYPRSLVHPLNMEGFWLSDKFRIRAETDIFSEPHWGLTCRPNPVLRQGKVEGRPLIKLSLGPDAATMALDNALDSG